MKPNRVVALSLSWDGRRQPARTLPSQARAFLQAGSRPGKTPTPKQMAALFAQGAIRELRICWVPQLRGGDDTLAAPFATPNGLRIAFRPGPARRFGDILGVAYRPLRSP